jgi:hypothetical protein
MATGDLYRQNFNSGMLTLVGSLGINISSDGALMPRKAVLGLYSIPVLKQVVLVREMMIYW